MPTGCASGCSPGSPGGRRSTTTTISPWRTSAPSSATTWSTSRGSRCCTIWRSCCARSRWCCCAEVRGDMSSLAAEVAGARGEPLRVGRLLPFALAFVGFAVLFWRPLEMLVRDWWTDPEAGHGLLVAPLALWLAWRSGLAARGRAQPALGLAVLVAGIALRFVAGLAGE